MCVQFAGSVLACVSTNKPILNLPRLIASVPASGSAKTIPFRLHPNVGQFLDDPREERRDRRGVLAAALEIVLDLGLCPARPACEYIQAITERNQMVRRTW